MGTRPLHARVRQPSALRGGHQQRTPMDPARCPSLPAPPRWHAPHGVMGSLALRFRPCSTRAPTTTPQRAIGRTNFQRRGKPRPPPAGLGRVTASSVGWSGAGRTGARRAAVGARGSRRRPHGGRLCRGPETGTLWESRAILTAVVAAADWVHNPLPHIPPHHPFVDELCRVGAPGAAALLTRPGEGRFLWWHWCWVWRGRAGSVGGVNRPLPADHWW